MAEELQGRGGVEGLLAGAVGAVAAVAAVLAAARASAPGRRSQPPRQHDVQAPRLLVPRDGLGRVGRRRQRPPELPPRRRSHGEVLGRRQLGRAARGPLAFPRNRNRNRNRTLACRSRRGPLAARGGVGGGHGGWYPNETRGPIFLCYTIALLHHRCAMCW